MTTNYKGIIKLGKANCAHHEIIRREEKYDNHEIGRCIKCSRIVDYDVMRGKRLPDKLKSTAGGRANRGKKRKVTKNEGI